jgi:hypothetical protein
MLNEPVKHVRGAEVQVVTNVDGNGSIVNLPVFVNPLGQPVQMTSSRPALVISDPRTISNTEKSVLAQGTTAVPQTNAVNVPTSTMPSNAIKTAISQPRYHNLKETTQSNMPLDLSVSHNQKKQSALQCNGHDGGNLKAVANGPNSSSNRHVPASGSNSLVAHITPGTTEVSRRGGGTVTKMMVDLPVTNTGPVPLVVKMSSQKDCGPQTPMVQVIRPDFTSSEESNDNNVKSIGKENNVGR